MKLITRRTFVGGAFTSTALLAAPSLRAEQLQTHVPPGVAAGPKGHLVYLDYDQQELDYAYDQRPWLTNLDEIRQRMNQKCELARAHLGNPQRFSYGPTDIEALDVYATAAAHTPIHVHIHGGSWRFLNASATIYQAEMNVHAGANFVALDFTNVTETSGNLVPLADQVRRAVAWVYENADRFGGDPSRLFVSGHSSGGHLAGVVVTTDWESEYGLPRDLVKGGILASGMYDLYPVSLSARRKYVNFTEDVIQNLSPQRHIDTLVAPVTIAYGTKETPEFQHQGRAFAETIAASGKAVTLVVAEGFNHLEIYEDLGNPYGVVGRSILERMGLS